MKNILPTSLVALTIVAGIPTYLGAQQPAAGPSALVSDPLNRELPKWLRLSGEYRLRSEGFTGGGFKENSDDAYLLTRIRINMKIQPRRGMKFLFQGQDARVFWKNQNPPAPAFKDTMDLRMAYLEMGDSEASPIGVRVGRQELLFGEQRLVGNTNWANTARSFDAVRATFRHRGYRLDAFAASVVNIRDGEFNKRADGNNLHGLYGGIEKLVPGAVIEPYLFWRLSPRLLTERGARGGLDSKTIGWRWTGKLPAHFDYGVEMAGQTGSLGTDRISAWAGHWAVGYTAAAASYKPRVFAEYNHGSGDKNPRDGRRGTFDQLYPTNHDKYGLADQVGWKNIHDLRSGVELKPQSKWKLAGGYHSYWLASNHDGLYNAGGTMIVKAPASGTAPRRVGQELDVQTVCAISKQMQVGVGYAHIFPGAFLKRASPGVSYNSPYVYFSHLF